MSGTAAGPGAHAGPELRPLPLPRLHLAWPRSWSCFEGCLPWPTPRSDSSCGGFSWPLPHDELSCGRKACSSHSRSTETLVSERGCSPG